MDSHTLNTISIASGIEGMGIGLQTILPTRTICYVERELSAAEILFARIRDHTLDDAPIFAGDLRSFEGKRFAGRVDFVHSGIPCQPFSNNGLKKELRGGADERNLWPALRQCLVELGVPEFFFLENVKGSLRYIWDVVRPELREMGYTTEEAIYSAAQAGGLHRRERVFVLAYRYGGGGRVSQQQRQLRSDRPLQSPRDCRGSIPAQNGKVYRGGRERHSYYLWGPPAPDDHPGWARARRERPEIEPAVRGGPDGLLYRVLERLHALGNAVPPIMAARAFMGLAGAMDRRGGFPDIFRTQIDLETIQKEER